MEYQWRPRPPTSTLCPVCSNSHFPFCPPLPHPQYFRPPPPPPDQLFQTPLPPPSPPPPPLPPQPSYDPFVDHQAGPTINPYPPPPLPGQIPPRPWNGNPNFGKDYYGNSAPGWDYDNSVQVGAKRMRFNNVNESHVNSLAEDERRLKLVRDHGATSHGLDRNTDRGYMVSNHSPEPSSFGYCQRTNYGERQSQYQHTAIDKKVKLGRSPYNQNESNVVQNHGYGKTVHGADAYNNFIRPAYQEIMSNDNSSNQEQRRNLPAESRELNNQFLHSHGAQRHIMQHKLPYYSLHNQDPQGIKFQPPLPASPPPPLPVEPPRFRFSDAVVSSPASGPASSFPVPADSSSSFQSPTSHFTSKLNPNSSGYYREVATQ